MDSPFDVQRTVQHEAINLAQWCHGSDPIYTIDNSKRNGREDLKGDLEWAHKMADNYYEPSEYDFEFEAYNFQDESGDRITDVIHEECK